jgi:hypothetical protein
MEQRLPRGASILFPSLVALLVAVGSQVLLDAVVPASFIEWLSVSSGSGTIYRADGGSFWPSEIVLRLVSFVLGGFVGARLARALSGWLVASLLAIAVLATVFQQYPGRPSPLWLVLWLLVGPVGVVFGAWAANAKRAAA